MRYGLNSFASLMALTMLGGLTGCTGPVGPAGSAGSSCTVISNDDGSATITCDDGTSATVEPGAPGETGPAGEPGEAGEAGEPGDEGVPGTSCTVAENDDGSATITCDDGTTATVTDGDDGLPGAASFNLQAEVPDELFISVLSITINDPVASPDGKAVVEIKVTDGAGRGAVGIPGGSSSNLRFGLTKLVDATSTMSDHWQSYINRTATNSTTGVKVTQATVERTGTLVDHLDGTYTYTFFNSITNAKDPVTGAVIPYDPTLTHRLAVQLSGSIGGVTLPYYNELYDFVPDGSDVTHIREVVNIDSCNECHGQLTGHGSRYETRYCVTCHNPWTIDQYSGNSVDLSVMVHGIHSAGKRATDLAAEYTVGTDNFSEVTFPQDLANCRKCHNGDDTDTPQGDYWRQNPSKEACGACHAALDFNTHLNMSGEPVTNADCKMCHTSSAIDNVHVTINATTNNPSVPTGAYNFTYELKSLATNSSYQPVVTFRILKDGAPMNFSSMPADLTNPSGTSSGPSFLIAYAKSQDGIDVPGDFNQLGKAAAQPASVSIANLINGSQGTLSGPDADGYYTATISTSTALYPSDAVMRAIALQGYYTQYNFSLSGTTTSLARHAVSKFLTLTGDPARRSVVDNEKCAGCHEWIEAHGGNRVYTTEVCVVCHNGNLSSSGRQSDPSTSASNTATIATLAALDEAGYDSTDPLTWPEEAQDFKTLIHGIHSSGLREDVFDFVRDRGTSGIYYYDMSEVTFPGILSDCTTCHKANTFTTNLASNVLMTTTRTSDGTDVSTAAVKTARTTVPNTTDLVSSPIAAACSSCHASELSRAHMEQNGGLLDVPRSDAWEGDVETCGVCHGPGRTGDVQVVHEL